MGHWHFATGLLWAALSTAIAAEPEPEHTLGDHPAVIVKRMEGQRGYDYAAKFYPHPAWLYLAPSELDAQTDVAAARQDPALGRVATSGTAARRLPSTRAR